MELLSVLICTVPSRLADLNRIIGLINKKAPSSVGIYYLGDNHRMSIGEKRNWLKRMAKGKYIAYIDDDDNISNKYFDKIIPECKKDVDVICFQTKYKFAGTQRPCYFSKDFENENLRNCFRRKPNHLMVIKKSIADKIDFENTSFGEDSDWANRINKHLKTQIIINKPLYIYKVNPIKSESRKVRNRNYS